ncbi:MAG: hypothetical protein ACI9LU_001808, partial [Polaribacter sp.]
SERGQQKVQIQKSGRGLTTTIKLRQSVMTKPQIISRRQ